MEKDSMLYIMHIDWDWIKQRPHFLAEEFSEVYDITVLYPISRNKKKLKKNNRDIIEPKFFLKLPFRRKSKILYKLNNFLLLMYVRRIIKIKKPNYIWISHPEIYNYIPVTYEGEIIYDCMDDNIYLEENKKFQNELAILENNLIRKSDKIFVTSENLKQKILNRYKENEDKIYLSRNAFNGKIKGKKDHEEIEFQYNKRIKICYIGTISSWFDIDVIQYSIEKNKNIEFHIIGPIDIDENELRHENIKLYHSIEHSLLEKYVEEMDILIMNFKLNEIIMSVDPVKLYEYINFNKPIISIRYPEIERFEKFVYFYNTKEEFYENINIALNNMKYTNTERLKFLKMNTWKERAQNIIKILDKKEKL